MGDKSRQYNTIATQDNHKTRQDETTTTSQDNTTQYNDTNNACNNKIKTRQAKEKQNTYIKQRKTIAKNTTNT